MKKSPWLLPAVGAGTAVLTPVAAYLILRFVPSDPAAVALLVVSLLLIILAVLGFIATRRGQAATFVAVALLLPYLLFGAVTIGGADRLSSEAGSIVDDEDGPTFEDDGSVPDEEFFEEIPEEEFFEDEGLSEEEGGAYGSDPELDALQDDCVAGDKEACSELFFKSPSGSEYEQTAKENGGGSP